MSDYEYEEEYQYEEPPEEQEEENIETRVELEYFEAEELVRKNSIPEALVEFQKLYALSVENNLKNYKVKILSQLLQIYCKTKQDQNIETTLMRIIELNKTQKYTENSIKSIISIIRTLDGPSYQKNSKILFKFIGELEPLIQLKSYLVFLDKAVEDHNIAETENLFALVERVINQIELIPAGSLLEFYSLEVKHSKNTHKDISDKLREMELKIPVLENEAYMSQGHLSVLKEAIAENMYVSGNYENCALYLADSFKEKAKYGNNIKLKEILKINVIICILIDNEELLKNEKYNMLFNETSTPFKNENDIQALFGIIDAFVSHDLELFKEHFGKINANFVGTEYNDLQSKVQFKLKKMKLIQLVKSYKNIKFSYIERRLNINEKQVEKMIFQLIVDKKIRGRIHTESQDKYLELLPSQNAFLETQLENLQQMSKRYF